MKTTAENLVHTRSGRQITIRDIRPDDAILLTDLFYHLSPDTIYKRFHVAMDPHSLPREHVNQEAQRLAQIDPQSQAALIALHKGSAVGVARFHKVGDSPDAEAAIVIRDDFQRDGLGTVLLTLLREKALTMGIDFLIAMVQAQNHPILHLINHSGLKSRWRFDQGETYLAVDIRPD